MISPISRQTIIEAHERIRPYIHHTPVMTSGSIDEIAGCQLFFKCENLQNVGAFKARGALNAVLSLSKEARRHGVATHSSGNHGQAVARAAQLTGIKAYIIMPNNASEIKKKGVRTYGGEIIECEPTLEARIATLDSIIRKTGAIEIHPYNNYDVMTGQATAAKELIEDAPPLDFIAVPVGGGGLLSGTALTAKFFSPQTIVLAGEPSGADDAYRSLHSGKIEPSQYDTIADGLMVTLGDKTFAIIRQHIKDIIVVADKEIVAAMRLVWERMKMIVEPSGVVGLAAVLKQKERFAGKKVGIIFSGGNIDLTKALKFFNQYAE